MLFVKKIVSVTILLLVAWKLTNFPSIPALLAIAFIVYFFALQKYPHCWLFIIPGFLPLIYLAPYSGRLFFDEFDLLLMTTISAYLWRPKNDTSPLTTQLNNISKIILFFFCIAYFIALLRGLLPFPELTDNSFASYYSHLNGLRIGKGFFWALCLIPIWQNSERNINQDAQKLFTYGMAFGSIGVFLAILWERGVLQNIFYSENFYGFLKTLLDFRTEYRATGLFAEMHTGDTATDGYLILALPFIIYFLTLQHSKRQLVIGMIAIVGAVYSILVTFSRGLYLGSGLIALLWVVLSIGAYRKKINSSVILFSTLLCLVLVMFSFFSFKHGGSLALLGGLSLFLSSFVVVELFKHFPRSVLLSIYGLIISFSIYCLFHAFASSKWNENDFLTVLVFTVLSLFVFTGIGLLIGKIWLGYSSFRQKLMLGSFFCILMLLTIPSLFGTRMSTRFDTVGTDLKGRFAHWQNALDIMDENVATNLFGQGVGTFPVTYYWNTEHAKDVGGYTFVNEPENTYVAFAGSPDVKLSQRVSMAPNQVYIFSADVKTTDPEALLQIRFCHRQLIQPFEWNPTCWGKQQIIKNTNGKWHKLTYQVTSENLGTLKHYLSAPLLMTFENRREYDLNLKKQTILDIDNLSLKDGFGEELLKNGDFETGIDHWFAFYDFNHLPWHIKNIWVSVYFDSGFFGFITFLVLVGYSLKNMFKKYAQNNIFSKVCFLAIAGFLCVGCFGTMIDGPRIGFLFYFIILIGLLSPNATSSVHRPKSSSVYRG
jgi:hypothetical protein